MKKIFSLIAIVLMSAVAANAQLVVGGSLGMGGTASTINRVDGKLSNKSSSSFKLDINPEIGYMLLDRKLEVGMALSMGYNRESKSYKVIEHKSYTDRLSGRTFNLSFKPYAKYDFFEKNGFSLGVKGALGLGGRFVLPDHYFAIKDVRNSKTARDMNDAAKDAAKDATVPFVWSLTIAPVLTYMPTEHFRIDASLTGLGLSVKGEASSNVSGSTKYSSSSASANLGLLNGESYVEIGAAYVF